MKKRYHFVRAGNTVESTHRLLGGHDQKLGENSLLYRPKMKIQPHYIYHPINKRKSVFERPIKT